MTLQQPALTPVEARNYLTARAWLVAGARLSAWLGVHAGAELGTAPGQQIRLEGQSVGRNPSLSVAALVGLDLRFLQ